MNWKLLYYVTDNGEAWSGKEGGIYDNSGYVVLLQSWVSGDGPGANVVLGLYMRNDDAGVLVGKMPRTHYRPL